MSWQDDLHTQQREALLRYRAAEKLGEQAQGLTGTARDMDEAARQTLKTMAEDLEAQAAALLQDGPVYIDRSEIEGPSEWNMRCPGITTEEEFRKMSFHTLTRWWHANERELSTHICNTNVGKLWPMTPEEVDEKLTLEDTGLQVIYHYQYTYVLKTAPAEQRLLAQILAEKFAEYAAGKIPDWQEWG